MEHDPIPPSFLKEVQFALQNLYDPVALRHSPLIAWLDIQQAKSPGIALQELITAAIRDLKPDPEIPLHANAWRFYHVLVYRYVEQTTQRIVAASMSLSERQLRRLEREAELALADYLWNKYTVHKKNLPSEEIRKAHLIPPMDDEPIPDAAKELEWLKESFPSEVAGVGELIRANLNLLSPILSSSHIELTVNLPDPLPPFAGQLSLVRQALMNLLMAAVERANNGTVEITASQDENHILITITAIPSEPAAAGKGSNIADQLDSCRQFTQSFGGTMLSLEPVGGAAFSIQLALPAAEQVNVLVIDDNADTLRLIERYLSGSLYHFIGTRLPEEALTLIRQHNPQVILLDVMMPGIADWEFLSRLRIDPVSREIPIVICTILPQEQLALSLGAAGFIRKPFSRDQLLTALHQQISPGSTESPGQL